MITASAVDGYCPSDCSSTLYSALIVFGFCAFILSCTRIPNFLLTLRAVDIRDKTVCICLDLGLISLFSLLPAPIIYGALFDAACDIW